MIIKEEKLTSKDLNNYKYRVDYNTNYASNFDDMISCAYDNANAICVRARMINPKTGKRYINDSQFYIIKNRNDFNKLKDCAKKYGYTLFSPKEINWKDCYTVDVFYTDKAGTYRVINKRKTESLDGKRRLRIARYNEFDNGKVLFNYDRMTIEDAEKLAKQKSIKDPTDIYYVKFDDIMNPTTDICWYQGKSYPFDKIDMVNGEIIIKENKNMVRKLHIRENIISDLYGLNIINMDKTRQALQGYGFGGINLNDCSLIEIDKPRTYVAAKKSDFPILGIGDNYSEYQGWGKPSKRGTAVVGIFGNDYFAPVAGDDRVRYNFESCTKFYKIVPNNIDTYQSQFDISKNRTRTVPGKLDDTGKITTDYWGSYDNKRNTLHKKKAFTQDDLAAYDPETNRKRYSDILSKNHLNKYIKEYDNLCNNYENFRDRLSTLDIRTVSRYNITGVYKSIGEFIDAIDWVNSGIKDIDKGNTHWVDEKTLQKRLQDAKNKADKVENQLTKLEV